MIDFKEVLSCYKGKRVLVTGNTGFKGTWLTYILLSVGADVIGYSLSSPTKPNMFEILEMEADERLHQVYADVRDLNSLKKVFKTYKPDIVIHLAAQPIVRDSYKDPVTTYSTNVMGTVNICEAIRQCLIPSTEGGIGTSDWPGVKSFLNVTTDKVYKNNEWEYGYREDDPLDGFDPYSNSKSCSEMVTHSYKNSFFSDGSVRVSTARAGNVIGGGDFSNDRIIPDCVRAVVSAKEERKGEGQIGVRNPYSIRPYQHVLEPLFVYLTIAIKQYEDKPFCSYYNVGPDDFDCVTTGNLVSMFCDAWNRWRDILPELSWENRAEENAPHEANFLKLDCSRVKSVFGWQPRWHIEEAIRQTVNWTRVWMMDGDLKAEMDKEIDEYINGKFLSEKGSVPEVLEKRIGAEADENIPLKSVVSAESVEAYQMDVSEAETAVRV